MGDYRQTPDTNMAVTTYQMAALLVVTVHWANPLECPCDSQNSRCKLKLETLQSCSLDPQITDLDLSSTSIYRVQALPFLDHVKRFNASRNSIVEFSREAVVAMPLMKVLDLSWNNLKNMPQDLLYGAPLLQFLNLTRNRLTSVPPNFFKFSTKLLDLRLRDNQLQTLLEIPCHSLKALDLAGNKLTTIGIDTFTGCSKLRAVDLSGNRLTNLATSLMQSLEGTDSLLLTNNRWFCDCELQRLNQLQLPDMGFCHEPPELKNVHVVDFITKVGPCYVPANYVRGKNFKKFPPKKSIIVAVIVTCCTCVVCSLVAALVMRWYQKWKTNRSYAPV